MTSLNRTTEFSFVNNEIRYTGQRRLCLEPNNGLRPILWFYGEHLGILLNDRLTPSIEIVPLVNCELTLGSEWLYHRASTPFSVPAVPAKLKGQDLIHQNFTGSPPNIRRIWVHYRNQWYYQDFPQTQ